MAINEQDVRDEFKQAQAQSGGQQVGGGPGVSDRDGAGGSSGTGSYGNAQNQSFHQGQTGAPTTIPIIPPRASSPAASASTWSRAAAAPATPSTSSKS